MLLYKTLRLDQKCMATVEAIEARMGVPLLHSVLANPLVATDFKELGWGKERE